MKSMPNKPAAVEPKVPGAYEKAPWEKPHLEDLGALSEIVKGGGKGTTNIDGEGAFKRGVG